MVDVEYFSEICSGFYLGLFKSAEIKHADFQDNMDEPNTF